MRTIKRMVFTSKADARKVRKIIDKALGFPIQPSRVGAGPWMPNPPGAVYTILKKVRGQPKWVVHIGAEAEAIPLTPSQWNRLNATQRSSLTSSLATSETVVFQDTDPNDDDDDDDTSDDF